MDAKELGVDWTYVEQRLESILARQLTLDEIDDAIAKYADKVIEDAIANEVVNFFMYGKGREIIKREVIKRLSDHGDSKL